MNAVNNVAQLDDLDTFASTWAATRGGVRVVLCGYHLLKLPDITDVGPVDVVAPGSRPRSIRTCQICTEPCVISIHAIERWQARVGGTTVDGRLALEAFIMEATTAIKPSRDAELLVNARFPGVSLVKTKTAINRRPVVATVLAVELEKPDPIRLRKRREIENAARFRQRTERSRGKR